jgi:carbamoyltransferase
VNILGISAFYHDSAACLVQDGRIVAAAQEERFTRKKHDYRFPEEAVRYCLGEVGLCIEDIDYVAFYDKPLLKFERLLETYIAYAPLGFRMFLMGMPLWLKQKLHIPREMDKGLGGRPRNRYVFLEHHESHAASAFFPSPFEDAAILTMDGVGEWTTGSVGHGEGNRVALKKELRFPHSLGLLYSAFTYFTGFRVNSGEYKLMGLAPYGEPIYADRIRDELLDIKDDGSLRLNMDYFAYCHRDVMTTGAIDKLFDGPPRSAESALTQREMDLAASIQVVTEEVMLKQARYAHKLTGSSNLVLAGGVALNCVGNGRILRESPFDNVWIQPAAGDAGGALGSALFVWHQLLNNEREVGHIDSQSGSLLGPRSTTSQAVEYFDGLGAVYETYDDEAELADRIAGLIAEGNVVGHMAGRMEFGPRALGNRSILGDPRSSDMQKVMNLKIKFRESFRPFAPVVLRDEVHQWFEMREQEDSPYMLLVAQVHSDRRTGTDGDGVTGLEKLNLVRSEIPAITHVDYSARVQTVDEERHPRFHRILQSFHALTGCPVLINTSFNVRGEPIVCTPEDAHRCFMGTNMDVLVVENTLLLKSAQPGAQAVDAEAYRSQFALD